MGTEEGERGRGLDNGGLQTGEQKDGLRTGEEGALRKAEGKKPNRFEAKGGANGEQGGVRCSRLGGSGEMESRAGLTEGRGQN